MKGPPPSFSKGTPIWAQILHLVLYALTESAKVNVVGSPKMKVKRYFHLRDDIYEYISIHWDVICRRERIKNWRHTIGMTLSHYQNLFQNGYHIYQNTGYWSMKDNVPSPYSIDGLMEGSPSSSSSSGPSKSGGSRKRKFDIMGNTALNTSGDGNANNNNHLTASPNTTSSSVMNNSAISTATPTTTTTNTPAAAAAAAAAAGVINNGVGGARSSLAITLPTFNPLPSSSPNSAGASPHTTFGNGDTSGGGGPASATRRSPGAVKFEAMKSEIDKFKREMGSLQDEIDTLQEQLQMKKAEEQLLKFLQGGISDFRDKIKNRIELLRVEMISNTNEHQQQIQNMSADLSELREWGLELRNAFQNQYARINANSRTNTTDSTTTIPPNAHLPY